MSEKVIKERLNITLLPETKKELEGLSVETSHSMVSILLMGYRLFKFVYEAQKRKAHITVTEEDGSQHDILFII